MLNLHYSQPHRAKGAARLSRPPYLIPHPHDVARPSDTSWDRRILGIEALNLRTFVGSYKRWRYPCGRIRVAVGSQHQRFDLRLSMFHDNCKWSLGKITLRRLPSAYRLGRARWFTVIGWANDSFV